MFIYKRRADEISDRSVKLQANVTIGHVTGRLDSVMPVGDRVTIVLVVGGARAVFQLDADTIVDLHGVPRS